MYPAYKPRDVLEEYALTFFSMLNEGYRQMYEHYYMMAQLALIPMLKDNDRKKFMKQLEWASKPPSDILKPSGAYATSEDVKRLLGQI